MNYIEKIAQTSTLFSFCFYYPDGSGGNLTTDNSASGLVNPALIEKASDEIAKFKSKGMIMAAPEVPLDARKKLLELGKQNNLFCTASFTSEEMPMVLNSKVLSNVDLLAINIDEASAICGGFIQMSDTNLIIDNTIKILSDYNENIMISITAGKQGSWCWDGFCLNSFPVVKTEVVSTAGAGDAFFAGLLCGVALGIHMFDAQQLATLIAGMSVQSPHAIHKGIDRSSLHRFMKTSDLSFSEQVTKLLED